MAKQDVIKQEGVIVEALGNSLFRVELDNVTNVILCHISGKIRQNNIRLMVGDRVEVEMSVYDLSKGRIVFRKK